MIVIGALASKTLVNREAAMGALEQMSGGRRPAGTPLERARPVELVECIQGRTLCAMPITCPPSGQLGL
jgi:hypothetical protein